MSRSESYSLHLCLYSFIAPPTTSDNCTEKSLRLVNGLTKYEGRVEVCYEGIWRLICPSAWGAIDARIVCNQLHYSTVGLSE